MTTPASPVAATPPGWYADPHVPGHQRWWDGAVWTEHVAPGTPAAVNTAPLKAPAGTSWNTIWIWLVVFAPVVGIIPLFTIDWAGYITNVMTQTINAGTSTTPSVSAIFGAEFGIFASPAYIVTILLNWVLYGASVVFAWRDSRALAARQVPKPFHWAWTFLSSIVYVIGRTVVVRRRTGKGLPPIWGLVAVAVLSLAYSVYLLVVITNAVTASITSLVY